MAIGVAVGYFIPSSSGFINSFKFSSYFISNIFLQNNLSDELRWLNTTSYLVGFDIVCPITFKQNKNVKTDIKEESLFLIMTSV